ncbi:MAG: long-chain acyl-CoA synthetase, partial [Natronomonas sp.]
MEYYDGQPLSHMGDMPAMAAHRYGEKTAVTFRGEETSFADLDAAADRVATLLTETGVEPGDRVGLFIPTTDWFPKVYFGAMRAGAIPVPLNLRMDPETLGFVVDDANIDVLFGSVWLADEAEELAAATG